MQLSSFFDVLGLYHNILNSHILDIYCLHCFLEQMNNCFLETNEILNNVKKLNNIPVLIIQGRHDIICPPHSAYKLNNELPFSKLTIIENAGHSAFESGIKNALINSLDEMKKKINSY